MPLATQTGRRFSRSESPGDAVIFPPHLHSKANIALSPRCQSFFSRHEKKGLLEMSQFQPISLLKTHMSDLLLNWKEERGVFGPDHLFLILESYRPLIYWLIVKGDLVFLPLDVLISDDV
jgi:hypothetical protein